MPISNVPKELHNTQSQSSVGELVKAFSTDLSDGKSLKTTPNKPAVSPRSSAQSTPSMLAFPSFTIISLLI